MFAAQSEASELLRLWGLLLADEWPEASELLIPESYCSTGATVLSVLLSIEDPLCGLLG